MIDVAHDGDHRRARLQFLGDVLGADEALFDVGLRHPPHGMTELLGDDLSGVGIDHIGDLVHLAVFHQGFDDVDAALGHAVGKLLNGDNLGDHHLALDLRLRLRCDLLFLALAMALQRGEAPLALLLVERVGDGETAAHAALFAGPRLDGTLLLVARLLRPRRFLFLFLDDEVLAGRFLDLALGLGLGLRLRRLLRLGRPAPLRPPWPRPPRARSGARLRASPVRVLRPRVDAIPGGLGAARPSPRRKARGARRRSGAAGTLRVSAPA